MSCPTYKRLCNKLVISDAVTFADDTLTINIPLQAYNDNEKYCIVVAQSLPAETTINAPVVITIGEGTTEYPLLKCDCTPVTACSINTRTRYSTIVRTGIASGSFVLTGRIPCSQCGNTLTSLPVEEAAATNTNQNNG
jgi:hypothetical protein